MRHPAHTNRVLPAIGLLILCGIVWAGESVTPPSGAAVDPRITSMSTPPQVDDKLAASFTGKVVAYRREVVSGIAVDCIYVNLNDPRARVDVEMASGGVGASESWSSLVHRASPVAAVNGTFFDKKTLHPTGDIVRKGKSVHYGGHGTGLCITSDNKACVASAEWGKHVDWASFQTVLSGGFMLLQGGKIVVDPAKERFRDSHVFGRARRTAIGITNINRLVLVTTRKGATPRELAVVMRGLQCLDAIGIDGGASAAMYYRGQTLCKPGRALTNILVLYEDGAVSKPAAASTAKPEQNTAPGTP
jgi:exopolysaccharide biosynthesis protein